MNAREQCAFTSGWSTASGLVEKRSALVVRRRGTGAAIHRLSLVRPSRYRVTWAAMHALLPEVALGHREAPADAGDCEHQGGAPAGSAGAPGHRVANTVTRRGDFAIPPAADRRRDSGMVLAQYVPVLLRLQGDSFAAMYAAPLWRVAPARNI
eukprot:CAMPEP_0184383226 /NCGR_PEP_ID=MMETSP0007-20130409/6969_1 /TAXON_ID=97485 /ORGANISM="Prymnesium parvum, Strain Texoma1" /LENGTH=152 /DNA_ID=CAMNT_0026729613 /DNA_START=36 /DNA_END=495 /DNA_ORIENTATION=+